MFGERDDLLAEVELQKAALRLANEDRAELQAVKIENEELLQVIKPVVTTDFGAVYQFNYSTSKAITYFNRNKFLKSNSRLWAWELVI